MRKRLILDVDTGTDDAVALLLAALHPELELVAATTVCGSVPVELATENTLRVLDLISATAPVFIGLRHPIVRADIQARLSMRPGTLNVHGGYLGIPPAHSRARPTRAVDFLIETYLTGTQDCTLVATGPLSNVATALSLEPRLADAIPELIIMGGGHQHANTTTAAEFNIWADPEAARVVLRSGLPRITLVPLDATHKALVSSEDCQLMKSSGTSAARAAASFIETRIQGYDAGQAMSRPHTAPVHDALCVAALVDPSIIATRPTYVDVELCGELTSGRTVMDTDGRSGLAPNAAVAFDANEQRFVAMLLETFARSPDLRGVD